MDTRFAILVEELGLDEQEKFIQAVQYARSGLFFRSDIQRRGGLLISPVAGVVMDYYIQGKNEFCRMAAQSCLGKYGNGSG